MSHTVTVNTYEVDAGNYRVMHLSQGISERRATGGRRNEAASWPGISSTRQSCIIAAKRAEIGLDTSL